MVRRFSAPLWRVEVDRLETPIVEFLEKLTSRNAVKHHRNDLSFAACNDSSAILYDDASVRSEAGALVPWNGRGDYTVAQTLIKDVTEANLLADRGYDGDSLLESLNKQRCVAVIPSKRTAITRACSTKSCTSSATSSSASSKN